MNRQEWLEYFEAINGRTATAEEVAQALAAGEFQEDVAVAQPTQAVQPQTAQAQPVQEPAQPQGQVHASVQQPAQPAQGQTEVHQTATEQQQFFQNVANSAQVADLKQKGRSYFNWFLTNLKNPIVETRDSHFVYGVVTVALAALFMAGGIVNYFGRIFSSLLNMTVDGETFRENSPEMYDLGRNAVSSNLGIVRILTIALLLFVLYAVAVALPALVNKYSEKNSASLKDTLGRYSSFTPLLALLNLVGLVLSFLTVDRLVISSRYSSSLFSSFTDDLTNPLSAISSLNSLFDRIPAIASIRSVATYLLVLAVLGFIVLITAFIKNIKASYKVLNNFYTTMISLLVLVVVIYFVDKTIFSQLISAMTAISQAMSNY